MCVGERVCLYAHVLGHENRGAGHLPMYVLAFFSLRTGSPVCPSHLLEVNCRYLDLAANYFVEMYHALLGTCVIFQYKKIISRGGHEKYWPLSFFAHSSQFSPL